MFAFLLCIVSLIAFANISEGYRLSIQKWKYRSAALFSESPKESIKDIENKQVTKGLTHIKYNKYAPSAEEAAGMTDEEFRGTIMRRMREAERERRMSGPVGSAVSDDYINSLGKKKE